MLPALPTDWPTRFLDLAIAFAGIFTVCAVVASFFERGRRKLPVWANCALFGMVACVFLCILLSFLAIASSQPSSTLSCPSPQTGQVSDC